MTDRVTIRPRHPITQETKVTLNGLVFTLTDRDIARYAWRPGPSIVAAYGRVWGRHSDWIQSRFGRVL